MPESRILIVEDELIVALDLEDRLRRQGYAVTQTARSAAEALAIIDAERVDLALLDVRLAGERDGVELGRDLLALDVPVVFLTAHGDDETLARIKSVEPQGYLLKPFDERLLHLTIETALHRHAAERARLEAVRGRRDAQTLQATILAHSPDGVLVLDVRGCIELANVAARHIFKIGDKLPALDELLPGLDYMQMFAEHPPRASQQIQARRSTGEPFPAEIVSGLAPLDDADRLILIVRDVSAQSQLERQLAQARQLEVTARLASSVAHDLNNLLSVVWMSTHMMRHATTSETRLLISELENAVTLGSALTTRLLSSSGRGGGETIQVVVNDALRTIGRLVQRSTGAGVHLVFELDPAAGSVHIDPTQLDQVILNLALNADRAMPEGGRMTLRSLAVLGDGEPAQAQVVIEIEDTGVGMTASVQRRLFEPFFSTHREVGGTGLGLSIVKDVIESVGGQLEFDSNIGAGTCFRITLPRHEQVDRGTQPVYQGPSLAGQGRAVLLVDNDEAHRRSIARLLETKDFRPIQASGPGDAMLIAERGHERFAFAIVDVEMPYMNGVELSARLKQVHDDLPVLLVSGSMIEAQHPSADAALGKPLRPESLFAHLARLLDEPLEAGP